jgi:hypothetical protein
LPKRYLRELMAELEKPRSQQIITVDHVLEATRGAAALRKREIISGTEEDRVRRAIITKFRSKVIVNTVSPRLLARIARAVARDEVSRSEARRAVLRLIGTPSFSIQDAFDASVGHVDFEHTIDQTARRLTDKLDEHRKRKYKLGEGVRVSLDQLQQTIQRLLR